MRQPSQPLIQQILCHEIQTGKQISSGEN